jgi:hypothetical protein
MANPAPCQACLEVADAEFYVTNRLGVPWPFEQPTVALCVPCVINFGITMGEALQLALAEMTQMTEPGALEAVEADEGRGPVTPAHSKSRRKPRTEPQAVAVLEEVPEEAPAPDEHG